MVSQVQDVAPSESAAAGQSDDYVPFAVRFRAWWEGVEPGAMVHRGQAGSVRRNRLIVVDTPKADLDAVGLNSELRYRLWSRLYGEGFSLPGGQAVTTELLKRCDLHKGQAVLDLAAGMGGTTRAAALQFGATVMGLEPDPEVAALGMQLSMIRGLEARVPISAYDPETVSLSERAYDFIFMRERLFRLPERSRVLQQISRALGDGGRAIITDLILAHSELRGTDEIKALCGEQEREPWTLGEFQEECGKNGLQIDLFRDDTDDYRRLLLDGWTDFSNNITRESLDREFVDVLMSEAEVVKRRIATINAGAFRFGYFELKRYSGKNGSI